MEHKALSFQEPYATLVALGLKTVECRTRRLKEPIKNLVVCASKTARIFYPLPGFVYGYAIGLVDVVDCVAFAKAHLKASMMSEMPEKESFAWILENARLIKPFPVKASVGFFKVDEDLEAIKTNEANYRKHFLPIAHHEDDESTEYSMELLFRTPEYIMEDFGL